MVLSVEQEVCSSCQRQLHVCDHRFHPILSLQGPLRLVCQLAHCPDPGCAAHGHTLRPLAEAQIPWPYWLIGWDVFSWLGCRRFTRHWSIPQLRAELQDSYHLRLADDAIAGYLQRYRCLVAARHQDAARLAAHYKGIDKLVLTIDGLPPEKGHETLYVVRELRGKDQGGPLQPPGLPRAEGLQEVRESLPRNLGAKKGDAVTSHDANSRAVSTGDCQR